jgi:dienelactone hydrolase
VNKLHTPLLIHTNTSDDDVHEEEVQHLIENLKMAGKKFNYEVFQEAPGGHSFDRIDTKLAKQTRMKIYKFLGQYLNPPYPFKSLADLEKSGYQESANLNIEIYLILLLFSLKKQYFIYG